MKAKFSTNKDNLIIEIPIKQEISNPYMEEVIGKMDNITGLITKDKDGNDEVGFAHLIDRNYKGKDPDVSDFFYKYWGEKEEFEKICKELKINIYYI